MNQWHQWKKSIQCCRYDIVKRNIAIYFGVLIFSYTHTMSLRMYVYINIYSIYCSRCHDRRLHSISVGEVADFLCDNRMLPASVSAEPLVRTRLCHDCNYWNMQPRVKMLCGPIWPAVVAGVAGETFSLSTTVQRKISRFSSPRLETGPSTWLLFITPCHKLKWWRNERDYIRQSLEGTAMDRTTCVNTVATTVKWKLT